MTIRLVGRKSEGREPIMVNRVARRRRGLALVRCGIPVLFVGCLLLINLSDFPPTWFDEGLNVSAAGMLARDGVYGLPDSTGPRVMDAAIQTGPIVIVPVALAFGLFGTELLTARLVAVTFALLALWLFWRLAGQSFDRETAAVAAAILLVGNSDGYTSFLYMGRQVLGEVPGLAFFSLGMLAILRGLGASGCGRGRVPSAILAGLAWGGAITTKSQLLVLLPAAISTVCVADLLFYRRRSWSLLALSLAVGLVCVFGWYLTQYAVLGLEQFRRNAAVASEGLSLHIIGLEWAHVRNAIGVIWRSGFVAWGFPGLAWALWLARTRDAIGYRQFLLLSMPLIALFWFVVLSIGWSRYAFYPFALLPMWTGHWLISLGRRFLPPSRRYAAGILAAVVLIVPLAMSGLTWSRGLVWPSANGFERMRSYLKTQVPVGALVESWEWQFSLDARQPIRHPDTRTANSATRAIFTLKTAPDHLYDNSQPLPDYVLEGPFSAWTGIYRELIAERGRQIVVFQPYALYRITPLSVSHGTTQR